jgi:YesN/AraC family two-component response regulator
VLGAEGMLEYPDGQPGHPIPGQVILVVDDDPEILDLHTRILKSMSMNYRTVQVNNGREALSRIRTLRPALVLLDLMMPDMDGFAVLEAMREDESTRAIPVIVVTAQTLTEEDMARLNRGVASVLSKGIFNSDETSTQLKNIMARKHKPGSEQQRIVFKAMAFIHTHYAEPISRTDVARYVGMSERHLTRCFQSESGLTPITYLNRFRVRQAKKLLDTGGGNITEVALDVGFASSGYFTRVFKEEVGVSPRTYLQQCRKK